MADRRDEKRLVEKRLDPDVDFEIIEIFKIVIFFQKIFNLPVPLIGCSRYSGCSDAMSWTDSFRCIRKACVIYNISTK